MDSQLNNYLALASKCEDLKSEERILTSQVDNIKNVRLLLLEKELSFCEQDEIIRASLSFDGENSLSRRCLNLIDQLVHYKCIIECLATDLLNLESKIMDDDEYLQLSLSYRQVEQILLQSIKLNQQRNDALLNLHENQVQSYLGEVECNWRREHAARREFMVKSILDHHEFLMDKMKRNLAHQQLLLNHRYQSLNTLINASYNS